MRSDLAVSMVHWCVHMKKYLDLRNEGMQIAAIRYEDIVADSANAMAKIFAYCDLSQDLVAKTKEALTWDSQQGTLLDNRKMKTLPLLPYTGVVQEECDTLCSFYGFPPANEFKLVEGTITQSNTSLDNLQTASSHF